LKISLKRREEENIKMDFREIASLKHMAFNDAVSSNVALDK
jgi:hypothetical protein